MMPPVSLPLMPNTLQVWPFCAWAAGANNDRAIAQASNRRIGVSVDIEADIAAAAPRGSRPQEQHPAANRCRARIGRQPPRGHAAGGGPSQTTWLYQYSSRPTGHLGELHVSLPSTAWTARNPDSFHLAGG